MDHYQEDIEEEMLTPEEAVRRLRAIRSNIASAKEAETKIINMIKKLWSFPEMQERLLQSGCKLVCKKGRVMDSIVEVLRDAGLENCITYTYIPEAVNEAIEKGILTQELVDEHRMDPIFYIKLSSTDQLSSD